MKTSQWAATSAAVITMCTLAPSRSLAAPGNGNSGNSAPSAIPSSPAGVLSAYPTIVQTGAFPTLTWSILYPSIVSDMVTVTPPGILTPDEDVFVTVQPVGTGVTACAAGEGIVPVPAEARVSFNGGTYQQLFYGTQADVVPSAKLYIKKLKAYETLNFGGSYVPLNSRGWSPFYTTKNSNFQVISLVNGDIPPTSTPLHTSPRLANYLKPYLDASGKVKIGPLSVLVMMELGQTNHSSPCFDYQDMVLLVTFSTKHPNNGHGNNLDGVDVSNPGGGSGGPNGRVDPSGDYDDEIR